MGVSEVQAEDAQLSSRPAARLWKDRTMPGWAEWIEAFESELRVVMTDEQAREIREYRMSATWRSVARHCHESYRSGWSLPSWDGSLGAEHQMVGSCICNVAAGKLDEDPNEEPWN